MKWALLAGMLACASPRSPAQPKPMTTLAEDDQLVARVRQVAAGPVAMETVEDIVGKPAIVNTRRFPLEALRRVELVPDPAFPAERFTLEHARDVVYWERPVQARDPHVVGIIVRSDGTAAVFFAIVLPP